MLKECDPALGFVCYALVFLIYNHILMFLFAFVSGIVALVALVLQLFPFISIFELWVTAYVVTCFVF